MHRLVCFIGTGLLALSLIGCGAPRPIKFYMVQLPAAPTASTGTHSIDILVGSITGPSLLRSQPIVYRTGANQIGIYQYHRWMDPPVEIVQRKLIRMLQCSGEYRSVGSLGSNTVGEFVVRGRLDEFAEVDSATGIAGQVTMEFELYNRNTGKILWSQFYSQAEPVQGKEVPDVVSALDRNLERGLKGIVAGLIQYFATKDTIKN
jgi:cholesterol transport system auxiliary component